MSGLRSVWLLLAAILLLAAGPLTVQAQQPVVIAIAASPNTFHPWSLGVHNYPYQAQFYDRLIYLNTKLEPVKQLATDYGWSADGLVFTVKLRKDVKFHSGKPLTSADVKWSWEQSAQGQVVPSANNRGMARQVAELRTPDAYTVEFVYEKPNPAILDFLDLLYIVEKEGWDTIAQKPAGSGPYLLKEFSPGISTAITPNPDYWGTKGVLDFEFRVTPDEQAMLISLESGSVQGIYLFNPREAPRLQQRGMQVYEANPDGTIFDVVYQIGRGPEPLKDKRVRKALDLLIDRNRFHRIILSGQGEARCLPFSPSNIAYQADLANYCKFDPDAARKLLAETPYKNGFDIEIMVSGQINFLHPRLGELLQNAYQQVGIRATVRDRDSGGYTAATRSGDFQIMTHTYGRANKDPANLFGSALVWVTNPDTNFSKWGNADFKRYVDAAAQTLDLKVRQANYRKAIEVYLEEMPWSSVHTNPRFMAHTPGLTGIDRGPEGFLFLWNARYAQ